MRYSSALFALLFGTSPLVVSAATPEILPLNYSTFEEAVPHVDLSECPESLQQENVFCRATLSNDAFHVFVFSYDGASPLVGFASFEADSLSDLLR